MKNSLALCFTLLLSGCISTYQDPRPVELQKEELEITLKEFAGGYEVIDSLNDRYSLYEAETDSVAVIRDGNSVVFGLVGKKTLRFYGIDCMGRFKPGHDKPWLYCDTEKELPLFGIVMQVATADREIKSSGLGGLFSKTIHLKKGDYLLDFHSRATGRPHYYILRKRAKK